MSRYPVESPTRDLIEQADQAYDAGQRRAAIGLYNQALALEPHCSYALVQRGLALQEEGRLDEALRDYNQALEIDPQYGLAFYGRGWAKNWQHDYRGEMEDARIGLDLDPDNPGRYLRRMGAALTGLSLFVPAVDAYTRAIELDPDDLGTVFNRSLCYKQMGRMDAALADVNTVLNAEPNWAWPLYQRGIIYEQRGELEKAAADIDAALRSDPEYAPALDARQRLKERLGEKRQGGLTHKLFGSKR